MCSSHPGPASQQQQHLKHQAPVNVLSSHIISALVVIKMMKKFISMETSMTFWPPAALLHDYLGGLLVIYGSIIYLGKEWRIGIGARFFRYWYPNFWINSWVFFFCYMSRKTTWNHHYILKKLFSFKLYIHNPSLSPNTITSPKYISHWNVWFDRPELSRMDHHL